MVKGLLITVMKMFIKVSSIKISNMEKELIIIRRVNIKYKEHGLMENL
jgi:hypothetical protein